MPTSAHSKGQVLWRRPPAVTRGRRWGSVGLLLGSVNSREEMVWGEGGCYAD